MKLYFRQQMKVWVLTLTVLCGSASTSQAGIIPWIYDAIFGPVGVPYQAGYGYRYGANYGSYYSPYAYGTGYGWGGYAGYGVAGNQCCNTCNTTVTNYAPTTGCCTTACAGNDCNVPAAGSSTSNKQPTPAVVPGKTLSDEPATPDDGFRKRSDEPVPDPALEKTDAFKIPGKDAVTPEETPVPAVIEDDPNAVNPPIPVLNLDTATTTHPVIRRTRTEYHARFVSPSLARRVRAINADWVPAASETRIAGK